jgi:large subunit ribosomal protein L9
MAHTKIVLTEDIYKLGTVGDLVTVKPGYARNYLIPKGYALRATKANLEFFEAKKIELEEIAHKNKEKAVEVFNKINTKAFNYIASASERGMLYGAVTPTIVANILLTENVVISKNLIQIAKPIKTLGLHDIKIALHNQVIATITLNIASSEQGIQKNLKSQEQTSNKSDDIDNLNVSVSTEN